MPTGPPRPKASTAARPKSTRVCRMGLMTCHSTHSSARLARTVSRMTSAFCQSRSSRPRVGSGVWVSGSGVGSVVDVRTWSALQMDIDAHFRFRGRADRALLGVNGPPALRITKDHPAPDTVHAGVLDGFVGRAEDQWR